MREQKSLVAEVDVGQRREEPWASLHERERRVDRLVEGLVDVCGDVRHLAELHGGLEPPTSGHSPRWERRCRRAAGGGTADLGEGHAPSLPGRESNTAWAQNESDHHGCLRVVGSGLAFMCPSTTVQNR